MENTNKEMASRPMVVQMAVNNAPKIQEVTHGNYIKYGEANNYPQLLIDLLNSSALHNSIINSRKDLVVGDEVVILNTEPVERSKTEQFIESVNPKETLHEVIDKLTYDYETFGGYALNVIWSKDRTKIVQMYHIDFSTIRSGVADMHGEIHEYFYSPDWSKCRYKNNKPVSIPAFNKDDRSQPSQLIYHKGYRPGQWYYPSPSYVAALNWIELDGEISNFHLSNIKNGMVPGMWVNFNNGEPQNAEQRKAIYKAIQDDFQGSSSAGKFVITFSDDANKAPTFQPMGVSDADKLFITLQDLVLQNVLSAHQLTSPMIAGIKTAGSLGGRTELIEAFELYSNMVVKPDRRFVLDPINKILELNNLSSIDLQNTTPISFTFTESILQNILTEEELREMIGKEAKEAE